MIPFRRTKTSDASGSKHGNPFQKSKTKDKISLRSSDTAATTSLDAPTAIDIYEYGDMGMDDPRVSREDSGERPRLPDRRRGGVLFKESSKYDLHAVRFLEPKKSILKVATVEDSLRSCQLHKEEESKLQQRPSLNLEMLSTSLRALLLPEPRGCHSCAHGMDLHDASEETSATWPDSATESEVFQPRETKIRFTNVHARLYPVSADDNPSASGKGPAIALHGWFFHTEADVSVDDYETVRAPHRRIKMEELKIDVMERRRRLLEAGVSSVEIEEIAARRNRAKIQRMQTMQSFSINGPRYMAKLERRERLGRFMGRAFGLRKTNSKTQAALWDLAQSELPAVRKARKSATAAMRRFSD